MGGFSIWHWMPGLLVAVAVAVVVIFTLWLITKRGSVKHDDAKQEPPS